MAMTEQEVLKKVSEALVEALGVDDDEVTVDAKISADLGAESIDYLAITFRKSGFVALYPTTSIKDFEIMAASASKGKYIWTALYHGIPGAGAPYQELHSLD